jgi:hypothetical protein
MNLSGSGQGPVAGSGEHGNEPSEFHERRGVSCLAERTISFSRRALLHGISYLNN